MFFVLCKEVAAIIAFRKCVNYDDTLFTLISEVFMELL